MYFPPGVGAPRRSKPVGFQIIREGIPSRSSTGSDHCYEYAELRALVTALNENLTAAGTESRTLRRSLDGARANVKRERERNVTQMFCQ